jgi:hypothetical protein
VERVPTSRQHAAPVASQERLQADRALAAGRRCRSGLEILAWQLAELIGRQTRCFRVLLLVRDDDVLRRSAWPRLIAQAITRMCSTSMSMTPVMRKSTATGTRAMHARSPTFTARRRPLSKGYRKLYK